MQNPTDDDVMITEDEAKTPFADSPTAGDSEVGGAAESVELVGPAGGGSGGVGASLNSRVKGPWSPEEDAVLTQLVSKFGARNWSLIARGIPGRSGKSCRLRWCNQLDPCLKRKPFTGKLNPFALCVCGSGLVSWFWVLQGFMGLICWRGFVGVNDWIDVSALLLDRCLAFLFVFGLCYWEFELHWIFLFTIFKVGLLPLALPLLFSVTIIIFILIPYSYCFGCLLIFRFLQISNLCLTIFFF